MTDRSSVIFGNKMPDKVYKKAVKSKKKYMKNLEMTPGKIMRCRSRRTVISEIPWGFIISWLEIRQRMHIMMSMRMRKRYI